MWPECCLLWMNVNRASASLTTTLQKNVRNAPSTMAPCVAGCLGVEHNLCPLVDDSKLIGSTDPFQREPGWHAWVSCNVTSNLLQLWQRSLQNIIVTGWKRSEQCVSRLLSACQALVAWPSLKTREAWPDCKDHNLPLPKAKGIHQPQEPGVRGYQWS